MKINISNKVSTLVKNDAYLLNLSSEQYINIIFEKLYGCNLLSNQNLLTEIENEAKNMTKNTRFSLSELKSFSQIPVAKIENGEIKPSEKRRTIGKLFNQRVRKGLVGSVIRSKDSSGKLLFICGSAVYERV